MKTECVEVKGEVIKILPNGFYRVTIDKTGTEVLAYLSGKMTKNRIRPEVSDKILMEMSPTDYTKGRIIRRF
jgi:translation initiation factor IF-1